jgi:hypothetical protein
VDDPDVPPERKECRVPTWLSFEGRVVNDEHGWHRTTACARRDRTHLNEMIGVSACRDGQSHE